MIEARGLTRKFGDLVAVDDLSVSVSPGEVFALLGPNGAGKTTTVRMLVSLIAPTSGSATVAGFELGSDNQRIRENVGVLTESPGLYSKLTARQNLQYHGRLHGLDEDELARRIDRYLDLVELSDRVDERTGSFSKGMKQRLAIARTLLHEPKVLFFDEPTAGLDPEAALKIRDFIGTLKADHRAVFLCTHNLAEAERMCDRVGVLKQRLIAVDTPDRLANGPGTQVRIRLASDAAGCVDAARGIPGVALVSAEGHELTVNVDDPSASNPELISALVQSGARVLYVEEESQTLEEAYLRIVRGGDEE